MRTGRCSDPSHRSGAERVGRRVLFRDPVALPPDGTSTTAVRAGDIGYWPPGRALALFYGPTPLSTGTDPVPASAVNLVGRIAGDASKLRAAKGARKVRIERA